MGLEHPDAFVLATVDAQGQPHQRSLLLKKWSPEGFIFFSNYNSPKGQHLKHQPCASAHFYWDVVEIQIRALGVVQKCPPEVGQRYWLTRSKASQMAQYVSQQSQPVQSSQQLEEMYARAQKKFRHAKVPCPAHWGGFEFKVKSLEFWSSDPRRLHTRVLYTKLQGEEGFEGWMVKRLQP